MRLLGQGLLAGVWLAALPHSLGAETAYVIDKLLVGVHAENSLDSPIIKVFPTGTQLEVLKRQGDLAQIKGPEGVMGWVDAVYLTKEQPAAVVAEMLEAQNRRLVEDLKAAQGKSAELEARLARIPQSDPAVNEELAELRKDKEGLRRSLDGERTRAEDLQAKLAELQRRPASDATVVANLRTENAALRAQLEQVRSERPPMRAALAPAGDSWSADFLASGLRVGGRVLLAPMTLLILGTVLLIACFACGVWLMDYLQRRRHGGFRI
ncbi:MAG: TIGR04211 family SH3 domain-containing protein [Chromatiales bacterium]